MSEISTEQFRRLEQRVNHLEGVIEAIEARDAELATSSNDRATPFTVASISVSPESAPQ